MNRLEDFEKFASTTLSYVAWDYYNNAAEKRVTYNDNLKAFTRYKIIPRLLRDVSKADTSTTVLGHRISFPVCIAPTGCQERAHNIAEVGTAQGAAASDVIFTLSLYSSRSIEEVANGAANCCKFFNLYIMKDRDLVVELVRRAERNGYQALVVTIDAPQPGSAIGRMETETRDIVRFPISNGNFRGEKQKKFSTIEMQDYCLSLFDPSVTWEDIKWLRSITSLPLILKGILSGDDAMKAVEVGASGILVSNHGGRQLDSTPATLDVLSEVVHVVNGRCEVYLDGGVRTGTDVLKALALGARAVFIGRPALYALTYNGADGVREMLTILKAHFAAAMAMSGCASVPDITSSLVRHKSQFPARL